MLTPFQNSDVSGTCLADAHTGGKTKLNLVIDEILRLSTTTRVTIGESPYTVLATDFTVFANTDAGDVTVNLPAGTAGTTYRIINTGSAANAVTVNPDGAELIIGVAASVTLFDRDVVVLTYEPTEGWW